MNSQEFRIAALQLIDYIIDYLDNIRDRQVLPSVEPFFLKRLIPSTAPQDPETWSEILDDLDRVIMPGMTHWHSPRFHAYFPTGNSYPSILADILSAAYSCIGFTWFASPICTELEMQMMDWLGRMLHLPDFFLFSNQSKGGGVIQGTASEATLVSMLSARSKMIREHNNNDRILSKLVAYASEQSHSSISKAALLAAVRMRLLRADNNLSLRGSALQKAIEEDKEKGFIPFFVVATLGTTNTCSFDNLKEIGEICVKEDIWLHIDAAYAGAAFICPEFRHLLNGVEYSNSFNFNPHKWLLTNFDCSTLWIKNSEYMVNAFNVDPMYLKHEKQNVILDYRHWQIPLGRRFRSLKLWFVFRLYGVKGLQKHIRKQVALAHEFENLVKKDNRFEIIYPVILGLVTFRIKGSNQINEKLVTLVNQRKNIYITPSKIDERFIIRFAICAQTTRSEDVLFSWKEIQEVADSLIK